MATAGTLHMPAMPSPLFRPIMEEAMSTKQRKDVHFDPQQHIEYEPPSEIIKMEDIGYPADKGVSPVAVSQPFRLFSKEAVQRMRSEIFSAQVMQNCKFSSNIAACQLRGYSSKYAPFVHDAWRNEEVLKIISNIAGIDLIPEMDFEIGHVNISVKSKDQTREELDTIRRHKRSYEEDEGISGCPWEDDKPVVGWHMDSYPFVCVLMLSDCTDMVGGETALRTGNGDVLKVRGPDMGCAVVLQGRYICHEALRALGTSERITMVTSFRPKSPHLADDTVLTTVRPISNLSDLYFEFSEYRLEMLEERIRVTLKGIRDRRRAGRAFKTKEFKNFLQVQEKFLVHTNGEIVPDEEVIKGYIKELDIPHADLTESDGARPRKMSKTA